jgi:hypothetical protein
MDQVIHHRGALIVVHRIRQQGEQGNHRSGRSLPCAPPPQGWGTIATATHRHCRGPGSGLRSGSVPWGLVADEISIGCQGGRSTGCVTPIQLAH